MIEKKEAFVKVIRPCHAASRRRLHGTESARAEVESFHFMRRRPMIMKRRKRGRGRGRRLELQPVRMNGFLRRTPPFPHPTGQEKRCDLETGPIHAGIPPTYVTAYNHASRGLHGTLVHRNRQLHAGLTPGQLEYGDSMLVSQCFTNVGIWASAVGVRYATRHFVCFQ